MTCLNITAGLFIDDPQLDWRSTGTETTASGATITANGFESTLMIDKGSEHLEFTPRGRGVYYVTFGAPASYIAILQIDTSDTHTVTLVDCAGDELSSVELGTISLAGGVSGIPPTVIMPSQGNGCVFVLMMSGSGQCSAEMFRSDDGTRLFGTTASFIDTMDQVVGEATATRLIIWYGGTEQAFMDLPAGECKVTSDLIDFPETVIGVDDPPQLTATIRNDGEDCLEIAAIGNVDDFSVLSTSPAYGTKLAPGDEFNVIILFNPNEQGNTIYADLPITRIPASGDDVIRCRGNARDAETRLGASSWSVAFGAVPVNTSETATIHFSATGDLPVTFNIAASSSGAITWPALRATVEPGGASQQLDITFRPTSDVTTSVSLDFTSDASSSPHRVAISGTGCLARAGIDVQPGGSSLDLGAIQSGFRTVRMITVRNTGNARLDFRASVTGSALFGVNTDNGSVTSPQSMLELSVDPISACGDLPTGIGEIVFGVAFYANAAVGTVSGQLVIDHHNDASAESAITYDLTATIIEAANADAVLVIDRSGSMRDSAGLRDKIDVALDAGRLFIQLGRANVGDRAGLVRFNRTAEFVRSIADLTTAQQSTLVSDVNLTNFDPGGLTSVAGGVLVGVREILDHPRASIPPGLTQSVIVLTDAMDNMPYDDPVDGVQYTITGESGTTALTVPSGINVYGVGIGDTIDLARLGQLSLATGGQYLTVATFDGADYFKLEKHFTQIYMDTVDLATIVDPTYTIALGQTQRHRFDVLAGDVSCMIVVYDRDGIRVPFQLETPRREIVDLTRAPAGFQLRTGTTPTARFIEVRFPDAQSRRRYAGRWNAVVRHPGGQEDDPVTYGFAIGAASNLRMKAFVEPDVVRIGRPIRLSVLLSEFGMPVFGSTVTVTARTPRGTTSTVRLYDDGAHFDGDADDGEYAGTFTRTQESGNYEFTFRASGISRDGEQVTREAVRCKYVEALKPLQGDNRAGMRAPTAA